MSAATKWLELAKIERQRARERDGTSEKLKQNTPSDFNMGGREMIDTTKEIIHMARQGKEADHICRRMGFRGMSRKRVVEVMYRYKSRIEAEE